MSSGSGCGVTIQRNAASARRFATPAGGSQCRFAVTFRHSTGQLPLALARRAPPRGRTAAVGEVLLRRRRAPGRPCSRSAGGPRTPSWCPPSRSWTAVIRFTCCAAPGPEDGHGGLGGVAGAFGGLAGLVQRMRRVPRRAARPGRLAPAGPPAGCPRGRRGAGRSRPAPRLSGRSGGSASSTSRASSNARWRGAVEDGGEPAAIAGAARAVVGAQPGADRAEARAGRSSASAPVRRSWSTSRSRSRPSSAASHRSSPPSGSVTRRSRTPRKVRRQLRSRRVATRIRCTESGRSRRTAGSRRPERLDLLTDVAEHEIAGGLALPPRGAVCGADGPAAGPSPESALQFGRSRGGAQPGLPQPLLDAVEECGRPVGEFGLRFGPVRAGSVGPGGAHPVQGDLGEDRAVRAAQVPHVPLGDQLHDGDERRAAGPGADAGRGGSGAARRRGVRGSRPARAARRAV